MKCVLGVDGGNTKTIAFVVSMDGRILGMGRSGNSDVYAHPSAADAITVIETAVTQALQKAGTHRANIDSACYSLAGADWQEDYDDFRHGLLERGLGRVVTVYNDAIGALRAGSPDGTGIVIACGTGGAIGARNANGEFWHSSFWQDSMCGRAMGYQAIRAVRHAELGIEPPTTLTALVTKFFEVETVTDLLRRFYLRPLRPPSDIQVSQLAPIVLSAAENGDPVARRIIEDHAVRLADYALAAVRKVKFDNTTLNLILNGGIFRHPGTFHKDTVINRIRQSLPDVRVYFSRYEPVVGAVMLAFEAIGISITDAICAALEDTMPSKEAFHTER